MDIATVFSTLAVLAVGAGLLYLRSYVTEVAKGAVARELTEHSERLQSALRAEELVRESRWEIKRQACLDALAIVDAYWCRNLGELNDEHGALVTIDVEPQDPPDIARARDCLNRLLLSCEDDSVAEAYKRCLMIYGDQSLRVVNELRNLIRKELGFGELQRLDEKAVFIARLNQSRPASSGVRRGRP